jgi:hypothetical protein
MWAGCEWHKYFKLDGSVNSNFSDDQDLDEEDNAKRRDTAARDRGVKDSNRYRQRQFLLEHGVNDGMTL